MISYDKDFGPSTVDQDEEHSGYIEEMTVSEIFNGDEEEMRSFRTNGLGEDNSFIPMMNRPQYESRIEEVSHNTQSLSIY